MGSVVVAVCHEGGWSFDRAAILCSKLDPFTTRLCALICTFVVWRRLPRRVTLTIAWREGYFSITVALRFGRVTSRDRTAMLSPKFDPSSTRLCSPATILGACGWRRDERQARVCPRG